jgi:hypothetical protein
MRFLKKEYELKQLQPFTFFVVVKIESKQIGKVRGEP